MDPYSFFLLAYQILAFSPHVCLGRLHTGRSVPVIVHRRRTSRPAAPARLTEIASICRHRFTQCVYTFTKIAFSLLAILLEDARLQRLRRLPRDRLANPFYPFTEPFPIRNLY